MKYFSGCYFLMGCCFEVMMAPKFVLFLGQLKFSYFCVVILVNRFRDFPENPNNICCDSSTGEQVVVLQSDAKVGKL